jgi:hypothetical protein
MKGEHAAENKRVVASHEEGLIDVVSAPFHRTYSCSNSKHPF